MILVTGGAGYIGSALVKKLVQQNKKVVVIDDLSGGEKKYIDPQAKFYKIDIKDEAKLRKVFKENSIKEVFHLAARKAAGESEIKPLLYLENNAVGTFTLLKIMLEHGVRKIIFSSTACVYQEKANGTYAEQDALSTYNVYGYTKLENENLILELARLGKLEYIIFRYFNVCGDAGLGYQELAAENIFPTLARAIKSEEVFRVFGGDYPTPDGSGVRDYIHLSDLVEAHISASEKNQIYNLGTKKGTSVLEIIKEFENQLGRKIKYQIAKRRPGDLAFCLANAKKAKEKLNWTGKKKLSDMVSDFIKVYKLN